MAKKRFSYEGWQEVAKRYDGQFIDADEGGIEVEVGDAAISVVFQDDATRFRSPFLVPAGPTFNVEDQIRILGVVLDQDVRLGHEMFDCYFNVSTRDLRRMKRIWTPRAISIACHELPRCRISSNGYLIELKIAEFVTDYDVLDAGIDLVAELANADLFGVWALEKLPGSRYIRPSGPWNNRSFPRVDINSHVMITVGPVCSGYLEVDTQVETREIQYGEEFEVDIFDGEFDIEGIELKSSITNIFPFLGNGVLSVGQEGIMFRWDGIVTDQRKLMAGIDLMGAFGRLHQQGVYR